MGRESDGMTESWSPCPQGRDLYEVSNLGRVRSWNNNRWGRRATPILLRLRENDDGYLVVNLGRGVVRTVHSLVCEAFHGPCPLGMEAAHGNGRPADNRAENLRWATPTDNNADQLKHGTRRRGSAKVGAKLTETDVLEIRRLRASGVKNKDIAMQFGVAPMTASEAARGLKWAHAGVNHGA